MRTHHTHTRKKKRAQRSVGTSRARDSKRFHGRTLRKPWKANTDGGCLEACLSHPPVSTHEHRSILFRWNSHERTVGSRASRNYNADLSCLKCDPYNPRPLSTTLRNRHPHSILNSYGWLHCRRLTHLAQSTALPLLRTTKHKDYVVPINLYAEGWFCFSGRVLFAEARLARGPSRKEKYLSSFWLG